MPNRREILVWALIVAAGALATQYLRRVDSAFAVAKPDKPSIAELVKRARVGSSSLGTDTQRALALATRLSLVQAAPPRPPAIDKSFTVASIAPPSGAAKLRAAMATPEPTPNRAFSALAALSAATAAKRLRPSDAALSAYGELAPQVFDERRLTILQLGDSHTAADFFTGRVRERLQQAFGAGGEAFIVPGKPHVGVRSALFLADASPDWSYEALQKSDDRKRFHLSGFNALAHHASASLTLKSRNGLAYDHAAIDFLQQPGGGRAQVLLDGAPAGEVNLDGGAGQQVTLQARAKPGESFHNLEVRALDDNPVAVAGVKVGRDGDGVSYVSIGYPGATVQLLQRLDSGNLAQDLRGIAPDVVVLAFGTNEGFNDNLDLAGYIAQYEQIVRRLQSLRPGLRIVIVGPADAARPTGGCHAEGVGQHCTPGATVQTAAAESGSGNCKLPVPPKLNPVREAQKRLAERLGAAFWDWSSVQPGPCGAQVWAAATPPLMAHDFVHMTLEGYKQSADRFADFLIPLIQGRQTATHVVSNN
jgi:lysophospholipase L1-like esterase